MNPASAKAAGAPEAAVEPRGKGRHSGPWDASGFTGKVSEY